MALMLPEGGVLHACDISAEYPAVGDLLFLCARPLVRAHPGDVDLFHCWRCPTNHDHVPLQSLGMLGLSTASEQCIKLLM